MGTGESEFTPGEGMRSGGVRHWAFLRPFEAAARAQCKNALGQAYLLVGKNNTLRIDPPAFSNPIELDNALRALAELPAMALSLSAASKHNAATMFLAEPADTFVRCP